MPSNRIPRPRQPARHRKKPAAAQPDGHAGTQTAEPLIERADARAAGSMQSPASDTETGLHGFTEPAATPLAPLLDEGAPQPGE